MRVLATRSLRTGAHQCELQVLAMRTTVTGQMRTVALQVSKTTLERALQRN